MDHWPEIQAVFQPLSLHKGTRGGCHWEMLNSKSNGLCYSQPDPEAVSQLEITHGWIMGSEGQGAGGCLSLEHSQTAVDVSPKGNIASLLVVS